MEPENDDRLRQPLDDEERELMDPDTWDWDSLEELPPVPNSGAVMAIKLSRDELTRVAKAARAEGLMTSEFIKQSALRRVMQDSPS